MNPAEEIRAFTKGVLAAREAYRKENHCGGCGVALDLIIDRRTGRKCEGCKRATNRAASARGYERRSA